jgi:hypothetical protein
MQTNVLELLLENYGTITLIGTSAVSAFIFIRKKVKNAIKSIYTMSEFSDIFGDSPAKTILEIHESIKQSTDILSIRQEIHEKHLQVGIYICEPKDGKTLWTNEYINDLFGLDSQEMKDFGWLRSVPFEQRSKVHDNFCQSIKNKTPLQCTYTIINDKTKKEFTIETDAFPVLNSKDITCYVGLVVIKKEQIKDENKKTEETKEEKAPKGVNKVKPKEEQKQ